MKNTFKKKSKLEDILQKQNLDAKLFIVNVFSNNMKSDTASSL